MFDESNNGQTHFEGCWRNGEPQHYLCALQTLKDLLNIIPINNDLYYQSIEKQKTLGFKVLGTNTKISEIDFVKKTVTIE